jgi:hypothetical protein
MNNKLPMKPQIDDFRGPNHEVGEFSQTETHFVILRFNIRQSAVQLAISDNLE